MKVFVKIVLLVLLVNPLFSAPVLELSTDNWKTKLQNKSVLVYMSLGCDIGSYSSQLFQEAMEDLQGVYVATFDVNSAYEMMQGKSYGLGTIALIRNGTVLESSKETYKDFHYLSGYNCQKKWVYEALKRHNVPFTMPSPDAIRVSPTEQRGSVDLDRGINAIYRFNSGAKDETGNRSEFLVRGTAKVQSGSFYCDGTYDAKTGGEYRAGDYGSKPFINGFTVHAKVKVIKTDDQRKFVLSFGYRSVSFEINKDKLLLSLSQYHSKGNSEYSYAKDFYPLTDIPFKYAQWNTIIFSSDIVSRRMAIYVNGVRYDDVYLSRRFVEYYSKYYSMGTYGVRMHNYGWGGVLNGYADDIVVYNRKLNSSEIEALYRKYSSKRTNPVFDPSSLKTVSLWSGSWQTTWGDSSVPLVLKEEYGTVTGSYSYKNGKVYGTIKSVNGQDVLQGTWSQNDNKGWFRFQINSDKNSFTGSWGYAGQNIAAGYWNGKRK